VAAVHYILGEQFDEDPFLLFRLRGRTQEQILTALRSRRAETIDLEDEVEVVEEATLLADLTGTFWDMGQSLAQFKTTIKPPVTEFPVLRRLGQPSFLDVDLLETLGPAYRAITAAAIATAFGEVSNGEEEQSEK
jgi:uncharacterized Zn finger protein